ncbi:MAG: ExbD/TolR family protein [Methylobacteriaceae bacterium]|jgi:biopolymer transport protein TolR|nr:ExbD/TolR family protein [Methylobacteriaceae bacterium]
MIEREQADERGGAELISDINVTPFIDIMLVLLIIFMVTAPLMVGGVSVSLPKIGGEAITRPEKPVIVSLDADSRVFIDKREVPAEERDELFKTLARQSESGEVYVRGDGAIAYARVMELMGELGDAGFARVILVADLKPGGGK